MPSRELELLRRDNLRLIEIVARQHDELQRAQQLFELVTLNGFASVTEAVTAARKHRNLLCSKCGEPMPDGEERFAYHKDECPKATRS